MEADDRFDFDFEKFIEPGKPLLICGAVQINIVARAAASNGKEVDSIERDGDVIMDIGGMAASMALSARHLGVPVRLLSALKSCSPYTSMIVDHLHEHNIDPFIQYESLIPDAARCVHVDQDGHVISAVSSNTLDIARFDRSLYESAMHGISGCIIDSSLSVEMIKRISNHAISSKVPVFLCVSSRHKSEKLLEINGGFSAIFISKGELDWLARVAQVDSSVESIVRYFDCSVIVMDGENGVLLYSPDHESAACCRAIGFGVASQKDYLCAGDILAVNAIVHHLHGDRSLLDALRLAMCATEEDAIARHLDAKDGGRMNCALKAISNAASIDALTGLPNRATALKKLEQLSARNITFFVAIVDVDHFKRVNDNFGHDVGDEALKLVAQTLSRSMRESDLCARWGGEEFLCIIGRGSETIADARAVMDRARQSIEVLDWGRGKLTVSVGMSSFQGSCDAALKAADTALYQSKRNGRNQVSVCEHGESK